MNAERLIINKSAIVSIKYWTEESIQKKEYFE